MLDCYYLLHYYHFLVFTGNVYIADTDNHRIRKVTVSTGIISTLAGTGFDGYNGDGIDALLAELYFPVGVGLDASGNLYIADSKNDRIRKLTVDDQPTFEPTSIVPSVVPSVAPTTKQPSPVPPTAPSYTLTISPTLSPHSVNIITTIAGTGTTSSSIGDGNPATSAYLLYPHGVVLDSSGSRPYYLDT